LVNGAGQTAFDLDVATMASMGDVRVGLTARNLRQAVDTQRQARLGAAFVPRSLPAGVMGPFSVAIDLDLTRTPIEADGGRREAAVGSEQWWAKGALGTRLGLSWNTFGSANPSISGGLTVRMPRSLFAEGHVTKWREGGETDWGLGARVTF
jgi:hypothetical protein